MAARARGIVGTLAIGIAIAGVGAGPARAAAPRVAVGSVPRLPSSARVTGAVRGARRVQLTVSLASRDPLGMQALATAVSTPGSPQFRHYLSVRQFARRFGASAAHIAAVSAALRREGLRVAPVDANHLSLNVSGPAVAVQSAFQTRLARVRMAGGRSAYADRTTPTLPASVAGDVDSVVGLNTLFAPEADRLVDPARIAPRAAVPPRDERHVASGGPQPCAAAATTAQQTPAYTADVIQSAYDFSGLYAQGDDGAGQTIAVYELERLKPADLAVYQSCYGTAAPVTYVNVDKPAATGPDEEAALDTEQLIGLAPGAAIRVYQAPDSAAAGVAEYSKIVSQDAARTISVSWGACEAELTLDHSDLSLVKSENKLFTEATLQGQSIIAASGDTGSAACAGAEKTDTSLSVQDPSSQPFATGVGGTSLYTETGVQATLWSPGAPLLESVWNDGIYPDTGEAAASTGGLSTLWAMPGYQRKAAPALGVIGALSSGTPCKSSHCRQVPDVSADGDPASGYVIYATTGHGAMWTAEGGTSAAAPLWAALTAEANALPACRGAALGFENPSLYALAAGQPGDLRDISLPSPVTGRANNDAVGTNHGRFPVAPGYDMSTGLGTPDAAKLAAGLCALRAPVYQVALAAPRTRRAFLHTKVKLKVRGVDSGKLALRYSATGLPAGLSISRAGVISGKARKLGTYTVTVTGVDAATNRATTSFPLTVITPFPKLTKASLTGVARRRPRLAFTVTKGRYAPKLRSVTIRLPAGLSFGRHGRGVHIAAGRRRVRFRLRRRHGALTLVFKPAQRRVRVTIDRGTLFAGKGIARTARRHRRAKVKVAINATDGHRRTTRYAVRLRFRR